jgi:hypothetical protein
VTPPRFARFDALCAGLRCQRPGPLLATLALPPLQVAVLHDAVKAFLAASAPAGAPSDERGLLEAFVAQGEALPWVTGSGRVLPTRPTAQPYAALVRAVADILSACGASQRLETIHLFSVKLKPGAGRGEGSAVPEEVLVPHLETWQGATDRTVAFHLPVLGDLERNFIQFYASTEAFDESWLLQIPAPEDAAALVEQHIPLARPPRPDQLVIFDAGTLHHTRQRPPCGPRATLEIMATLPGPSARVDHRPWDQALPVERFMAIGQSALMLPDEPVGKTVRVGSWERYDEPE